MVGGGRWVVGGPGIGRQQSGCFVWPRCRKFGDVDPAHEQFDIFVRLRREEIAGREGGGFEALPAHIEIELA